MASRAKSFPLVIVLCYRLVYTFLLLVDALCLGRRLLISLRRTFFLPHSEAAISVLWLGCNTIKVRTNRASLLQKLAAHAPRGLRHGSIARDVAHV